MLPEIVYLTQLDTGTRIALPLTPEKVSDKREGNFISYNILNVGEVKIPNGEVALLAEGVDRNAPSMGRFRRVAVALLAEGVDRNP